MGLSLLCPLGPVAGALGSADRARQSPVVWRASRAEGETRAKDIPLTPGRCFIAAQTTPSSDPDSRNDAARHPFRSDNVAGRLVPRP